VNGFESVPDKEKNTLSIDNSLQQYIVRNYEQKGYETVYSSTGKELPEYLLPLILPKFSIEKKESYYFKFPLKEDKTLVKLVVGDGIDNFGRNKAKIIILIIPNNLYEENFGLLYYANPIWKKRIPLKGDRRLSNRHFTKITPSSITTMIKRGTLNSKLNEYLLEKILLYEHVIITLQEKSEKNLFFLNKTLAYLDYCIPKYFRNKLSIKTACDKKNYNFANCSILLDDTLSEDEINENEVIINFSDNFLNSINSNKFNEGKKTLDIVKMLLNMDSISEKEDLGNLLLDQKRVLKEKIMPNDAYKNLLNRFNIKSQNGFSGILTQLKNNL
jgi:hypothetical protein